RGRRAHHRRAHRPRPAPPAGEVSFRFLEPQRHGDTETHRENEYGHPAPPPGPSPRRKPGSTVATDGRCVVSETDCGVAAKVDPGFRRDDEQSVRQEITGTSHLRLSVFICG